MSNLLPLYQRKRLYDEWDGVWKYSPVIPEPRKLRYQMVDWDDYNEVWRILTPMQGWIGGSLANRNYAIGRYVGMWKVASCQEGTYTKEKLKYKQHMEYEGLLWEALKKHVGIYGVCDGFSPPPFSSFGLYHSTISVSK